ncbi:hypothetical protein MC885_016003, partial [Smutsia gigantea]
HALEASPSWHSCREGALRSCLPALQLPGTRQRQKPLQLESGFGTLPSTDRVHKKKESYHMSTIQNLHSFDPFADASKGDDLLPAVTEDYIHIRIQQRNSSKTLTAVQGITDDYDKRKLVKAFKNKFACNGTRTEPPAYGEAIQVQGDPECKDTSQFLGGNRPAKDHQPKAHGF